MKTNSEGQIIHIELATPEEQALALLLVAEGKTVEFIPRNVVRTPDAFVDGVRAEFKTIKKPTADNLTIRNAIRRGKSQSGVIIIDARNTEISIPEVERGIARGFGAYEKVQSVRVIGKDFDITRVRQANN